MNKTLHYVGLDVHKESIAVSIAPANSTEVRRYGIIGGSIDAVDKLLKKLGGENIELRVVYEAGPCGFVLCRHLRSQGIHCDVVSPSLIPKKASDRVKTDRRDAEQLARNRITGGKIYSGKTRDVKSWVAEALRLAAQSLWQARNYFGDLYRRWKARLGSPKAITAMAHKLARVLWHLLKFKEAFNPEVFAKEEAKLKRQKLQRLQNMAAALNYQLVPQP